jgi:hypothetical protein
MEGYPMRFDIVAQDSKGRRVLLVEVRAKELDEGSARSILSYIRGAELGVPFGMVADLNRIRVVDFERAEDADLVCVFDSADVLCVYDPAFGTKRIFHNYLTALVEAWLRDHTYHWHSEKAPGAEKLDAIGLAPLLEGGTTHREVTIETDSVC